jgi:hypothetical protein
MEERYLNTNEIALEELKQKNEMKIRTKKHQILVESPAELGFGERI